MPTPTELTPAEIASLERDIAERVMEWKLDTTKGHEGYYYRKWCSDNSGGTVVYVGGDRPAGWSPWKNAADALEVLKRLEQMTGRLATIEHLTVTWLVVLGDGDNYYGQEEGDHFGPAVCRLAGMVMGAK